MNSFIRKRQRKSWKYIQQYYPEYKSKSARFKELITDYIKPSTIMADFGCGRGLETALNYKKFARKVYGIDVSDSICDNETIHEPIKANLCNIPLKDNSLDLAVSQEVLEHLEHPEKMFSEICRVLKPAGHFILMTPNLYYPTTFLSSITPFWFHHLYAKHLLGRNNEADMFPTFYKANTLKVLKEIGAKNNLTLLYYDLFQCNPGQFSFSPLLTYVEVGFIRLIDKYKSLEQLRDIVIVIMRKN